MRFRLDILKDNLGGWSVTAANVDNAAAPVPIKDPISGKPWTRQLRRREIAGVVYPQPLPQVANTLAADAPHRLLCTSADPKPILDLHGSIVEGRLKPGDMERFGRYLFDTLLGDVLWEELLKLASNKVEPIELDLSIHHEDLVLNKLPWEMMHGKDEFLAKIPKVAIVRQVAGAGAPANEPLASPPRVLFVVGTTLNDEEIRPGAEYLRMLQALQRAGNQLSLTTKLIQRASAEKLEAAVIQFRPDVVHFICHGWYDKEGRGYLDMVDPKDPSSPATVYAGTLRNILETKEALPLPSIVVLSACYTASIDLAQVGQVATPLAAELVEGGIPMVVGMSGRVLDQACRLFTRRFYEALLDRGDVALATAEGRLAALRGGNTDPETSVDWTLPTLFVSGHEDWKGLELEPRPEAKIWYNAAANYMTPAYPAFCDRLDLIETFDGLMAAKDHQRVLLVNHPAGLQAVGISVGLTDKEAKKNGKLGRSWLLKELACKSARDGHVPCLVDPKDLIGKNPKDLEDLVKCFYRAANKTKDAYNLNGPVLDNFRRLAEMPSDQKIPDDMPQDIHDAAFRESPNSAPVLAAAFRLDLDALLEQVHALRPEPVREQTKLVLLIDDVHRMDAGVVEALLKHFLHELRAKHDRMRAVFTYSTKADEGQELTIKAIDDWFSAKNWAVMKELKPFRAPVEEQMAYMHFLLNWKDRPLVLVRDSILKNAFLDRLSKKVRGVPSRLKEKGSDVVEDYLRISEDLPVLLEADDESRLGDAQNLSRG